MWCQSGRKGRHHQTAFQQDTAHSTTQTPAAASQPHEHDHYTRDHESMLSDDFDDPDFYLSSDDSELEDITSPAREEDKLAYITSQMEKLVTAHNEKYPELVGITTVSPAEFDELYPTPEDRRNLAELAQKAQKEFMGDFRNLFSQLPADVREENLSAAREILAESIGAAAADAVMSEIRSRLEQ